jgi:hypothetical protein
MKNRKIVHAREQAEIYKAYYRPSFNLVRFAKTIIGILFFGSTSVAQSHVPIKKRSLR